MSYWKWTIKNPKSSISYTDDFVLPFDEEKNLVVWRCFIYAP